jgi:hypothetical protein
MYSLSWLNEAPAHCRSRACVRSLGARSCGAGPRRLGGLGRPPQSAFPLLPCRVGYSFWHIRKRRHAPAGQARRCSPRGGLNAPPLCPVFVFRGKLFVEYQPPPAPVGALPPHPPHSWVGFGGFVFYRKSQSFNCIALTFLSKCGYNIV